MSPPSDNRPDDPEEPASPSCFAHEADDAYMGFASAAEIAALLAEVRGTAFDQAPARDRLAVRLRQVLPKVRDDRLHRRLAALLAALDAGNMPAGEVLKGLA
jgi:hypothetical protein